MESVIFFVSRKGIVKGPFDFDQIKILILNGKLFNSDKIKANNEANWILIGKSEIFTKYFIKKENYDKIKKDENEKMNFLKTENKDIAIDLENNEKNSNKNYVKKESKLNNYIKIFKIWFFEKDKFSNKKEWFIQNIQSQKGSFKLLIRCVCLLFLIFLPLLGILIPMAIIAAIMENASNGYAINNLNVPEEMNGSCIYKIVWDRMDDGLGSMTTYQVDFFDTDSKKVIVCNAIQSGGFIKGWDKQVKNNTKKKDKSNFKYGTYNELRGNDPLISNLSQTWRTVEIKGSVAVCKVSGRYEYINGRTGVRKISESNPFEIKGKVTRVK